MTESPEAVIEAVNAGRECALVLQVASPLIDEMFDTLVTNAIAKYRSGKMLEVDAMVFVGKLDALTGFREELESRVVIGEHAASTLNR